MSRIGPVRGRPRSGRENLLDTPTVWRIVADRNHESPNSPDQSEAVEGVTSAGFAVVRRGYDPDAVEAYLQHLDAQVQILAADRDAAVEQSRQMGVELEACRGRSSGYALRSAPCPSPG